MRFTQPEGFDFRWTVVVVSIGVVLTSFVALYWMSTATYSAIAQ
jgi:hypothetical protein